MEPATKKSILIVEDEQFLRDLYRMEFEENGIATDVASGGKEGIEKAKAKRYDGILLDIMMPDLSGIEVMKVLKQDPATKDIPVIFLTNMGQEDVIKEGIALGAVAYLIKSTILPDQLIEKVTMLLDQHATPSSV